MRRWRWAAAFLVLAGVSFAIVPYSSVCACPTVAERFASDMGLSLRELSVPAVRASLAQRWPRGVSARAEITSFLKLATHEQNPSCESSTESTLVCRYLVETGLLAARGFEVAVDFDGDQVAAFHVSRAYDLHLGMR